MYYVVTIFQGISIMFSYSILNELCPHIFDPSSDQLDALQENNHICDIQSLTQQKVKGEIYLTLKLGPESSGLLNYAKAQRGLVCT